MSRLHSARHTARHLAVLLAAPLAFAAAACAPTREPAPAPAATPPAMVEQPGEASCNAPAAQRFVGQKLDGTVQEGAKTAAGARTVRVIEPGMAVTMDYRYDRLNIEVDDAGRILRIHCG